MKEGFVKSSPYFFRRIGIALGVLVVLLLLLAPLVPAPLQVPADPARVPNPVKSGWFLLWLQELVSYSSYAIYLTVGLGLFFLLLPWLPLARPVHRACWFPPGQRLVTSLTVATFLLIVALTVLALFFRGANWSLVLPF